jgi:hypothetical protein
MTESGRVVEAERKFYGNRWDDKISITVVMIEEDCISFLDLPVHHAKKLAEDILKLVTMSEYEPQKEPEPVCAPEEDQSTEVKENGSITDGA